MRDPFAIEGPAVISFSGGRTSAFMLRQILDAGIGPDVHVNFQNTGKERAETLDFVREVETRWGVPVQWCERPAGGGFVEVNYATASRKGEPFEQLIREKNFLPNPRFRFCTGELKIQVEEAWMLAHGYEEWGKVVGLRADELGRVAQRKAEDEAVVCPLATAGVTKADVMAFWSAQPFDLQLKTWEGNCDLCFLKGAGRRMRIIRDNPGTEDWWIAQESQLVGVKKRVYPRFRNDAPSYARLAQMVRDQPLLPGTDDAAIADDDSIDCFCTN